MKKTNIINRECVKKNAVGFVLLLSFIATSIVDAVAGDTNATLLNAPRIIKGRHLPLVISQTESDSDTRRPRVRRTGESTNPETVESVESIESAETPTESPATEQTSGSTQQQPTTSSSVPTVTPTVAPTVTTTTPTTTPVTTVTEPAPTLVIPKPIPQTPTTQTTQTSSETPPVSVSEPEAPAAAITTITTPKPQRQEMPASAGTTTEKPLAVPTPVVAPTPAAKEAAPTIQTEVKRPRRTTNPAVPPMPTTAQPAITTPIPTPKVTTNIATGQKRRPLPRVDFDGIGTHTEINRWRIVDALGYPRNILDPYNTNSPLKADRPIEGTEDWFFDLSAISDTLYESRYIPIPVGVATTNNAVSYDTLGSGDQKFINQNLEFEFVLYKGDSIYKPPEYEFRFIPVFSYNRLEVDEIGAVKVNPKEGNTRTENFVGIQGLYADVHLRDVSSRYDFDSLRIGIQPFNADFRGFLFLDRPFGVRLFGTRDNNIFQYNFAWLKRFDKDINSGLNDISELRDDEVLVGNLYWQDMPVLGFTSQFTVLHNRNSEGDSIRYDENGFIQRPASLFEERGGRDYNVTYLGYSGDGHLGRINLDTSIYYALGSQNSTTKRGTDIDISAFMAAVEASMDMDWMRFRLSGFYGSGDKDPFDDVAQGFDAVFDNPTFAGSDSSYYLRQGTPFVAGGGVALSQRNSILNSLKSSKEQGQSNFVNPGVILLGIGTDLDVSPTLRLTVNLNQLWFENTAVLEVLRQQSNIDKDIGRDFSIQAIYRPWLSQNIVMQFSYSTLIPGNGYIQLFGENENPSAIVANLILTY